MKFAQMDRDTQYLIATLLYTLEERMRKGQASPENPQDIVLSIMTVGYLMHGDRFEDKLLEEILDGLMESDLGKNKVLKIQDADPNNRKREARAIVYTEFTQFLLKELHMIKAVWENRQKSLLETLRYQIEILDKKYQKVDIRQNLRDLNKMKELAKELGI